MKGLSDTRFIKPSLLPETLAMEGGGCVVPRALEVRSLGNAVVCPGKGVFRRDGTFVDETYIHAYHPSAGKFRCEQTEESSPKIHEAVYIGAYINIWGHCLTDGVKFLWPLLKRDRRFEELPLIWVSLPGADMFDNFRELLELLGVNLSHLVKIENATAIDKLWIPDPCFFVDHTTSRRYCTPEYGEMFDKVKSALGTDDRKDRKIYFTRSSLKEHNRDFGERSVERVFKQMGYEIYSPEKMRLRDMVALMNGCSSFAATDGSIAHNSVFLDKGAQLVIIRKADTVNGYQAPINEVRELNTTIIDANWSRLLYQKRSPWDGPFFIYNNSRLRKWSGIWTPFPLLAFAKYVLHYAGYWLKSKIK